MSSAVVLLEAGLQKEMETYRANYGDDAWERLQVNLLLDEQEDLFRRLLDWLNYLEGPWVYYPFSGFLEPMSECLARRRRIVALFHENYPAKWRREETRWRQKWARLLRPTPSSLWPRITWKGVEI